MKSQLKGGLRGTEVPQGLGWGGPPRETALRVGDTLSDNTEASVPAGWGVPLIQPWDIHRTTGRKLSLQEVGRGACVHAWAEPPAWEVGDAKTQSEREPVGKQRAARNPRDQQPGQALAAATDRTQPGSACGRCPRGQPPPRHAGANVCSDAPF